jgi:hypothetical protein
LKEYASHANTRLNFGRIAKPQHWFNLSFGTSKCHIALSQNSQKQYLGCEVYIRNDKQLYQNLLNNKESIEKELGYQVEWMELPDATASRVIVTHKGDPRNKSKWEEYNVWLMKTAEEFAKVFIKYIK